MAAIGVERDIMKSSPVRSAQTRRALLLSGLGTLASVGTLASCASTPPAGTPIRRFEPPTVRRGDRWIYREVNRYNNGVVAEVEVSATDTTPLTCQVRRTQGETTAGAISRPGGILVERYATPWSVIEEPIYNFPLVFAEPVPLMPPVLQVGASINSRTTYTIPGFSARHGWRQRLHAVGAERIATPAGTFDCLRVRRVIDFDHPDPFRLQSSRTDEIWYAERINRWVRREWTGEYRHQNFIDPPAARLREDWVRWELLSYTPAA